MESTTGMATLVPRVRGRYLAPIEVVRRVGAAFAYVETTEEDARKQVLELMSQLAFVAAEGRAAADDDYLAQLDRLQDAARSVHFGDDLGSDDMLLSMLMIPQQPLTIEHRSDGHPEETQALIARCAKALDYEIVEQGNVAADAAADARSDSTYATAPPPERRQRNTVSVRFIPTNARGASRFGLFVHRLISMVGVSFSSA